LAAHNSEARTPAGEDRWLEAWRERGERVLPDADGVLGDEAAAQLREARRPAVVEVLGRDSVAAAVAAGVSGDYDLFLPTVAYTGTEYGEPATLAAAVAVLRRELPRRGAAVAVLEPVALGSPRLWRMLCGRYAAASAARFGFHTPCLGCHLYLHALRIPLARAAGCRAVIAGEREDHDGRVKLNQVAAALDAYVAFAARFGVELVLPLRREADGAAVAALVGGGWAEGEGQPACVLAGNYLDAKGGVSYEPAAVRRFLEDYAVPAAARAVEAWLAGRRPDYGRLAEGLWP